MNEPKLAPVSRRRLVQAGVLMAGAALLGPFAVAARAASRKEPEEEVSPAEDLMREHGVLNRLLLVYEAAIPSLDAGADSHLTAIGAAADLIRRFVEDYHEKLEEQHLFPRFEKAGRLKDLVAVLRSQHDAGRRLTDDIQALARSRGSADRKTLAEALRRYVRMYRPHEAREDTVLFPEFRKIVPEREYASLGERFEEKEHELFGKDGFSGIVEQVAEFERGIGIHDLAQFTPVISKP